MTLNSVWCLGSSNAVALGNVVYSLIANTLRSTLARSGSIWKSSIGEIEVFDNFVDLYFIELWEIEPFDSFTVYKQMTDV